MLVFLNANKEIRRRTDTDVAFTQKYSRVSIFHEDREVYQLRFKVVQQ